MDDNKNLIIAVVLMLLVWFGFSTFFPQAPPVQENQVAESPVQAPVTVKTATEETPLAPTNQVLDTAERQIRVETDFFRAKFTSSGARLLHYELKEYRVTAEETAAPVVMVDASSAKQGTLRLEGLGDFSFNPDVAFAVVGDVVDVNLSGDAKKSLVFRAVLPSGILLERRFEFQGNSYAINSETVVVNNTDRELRGQLGISLIQPWDDSIAQNKPEYAGGFSLVADKLQTESPKDIQKESVIYEENLVWSGFKDNYFFSSLVPIGTAVKGELRSTVSTLENRQISSIVTLPPKGNFQQKHLIYFGPLDLDILQGIDHQLTRAVDFGFFTVLAKPLFHVLRFFYNYLGNYGLAIILLTVIIKLLFWPLTQKSYSSMKAMQKLQPEMQKIREKYKNDRERMNREVMELYKNHRVSPLGGCLPMLVQIPVFFALYQVLMVSIELRQAPFYFWITDLAQKDPYYVTPIIMGVTMFLQQKMTPVTGVDPMQAKIFLFLPVIFTVMFLNFPAGLVLYWLVNNVLTILQQYLINRKPA